MDAKLCFSKSRPATATRLIGSSLSLMVTVSKSPLRPFQGWHVDRSSTPVLERAPTKSSGVFASESRGQAQIVWRSVTTLRSAAVFRKLGPEEQVYRIWHGN